MLTKQQRIEITAKIVNTKDEVALIDQTISQVQEQTQKLLEVDQFNKSLLDKTTAKITPYQDEGRALTGRDYTNLLEQDIINAGNRTIGNFFFPNENSVPLPSTPDGVWKNYSPSHYSYSVGKNKLEVYSFIANNESTNNSGSLQDIADLLLQPEQNTVSGNRCITGTPPTPDSIVPDTVVRALIDSLKLKVENTLLNLNDQLAALNANSDTDPNINIAKTNIQNYIPLLQEWLDLPDYVTIPAGTCLIFNSFNVNTLPLSKGRFSELNKLDTALRARDLEITTRSNQIDTKLGTVTQDPKGNILTSTGFYGERAVALNIRLNAIGGSLTVFLQNGLGVEALGEQKKIALDTESFLRQTLEVSELTAHANGTGFLFLSTPTNFNVGQNVFVCANDQDEIPVKILEKTSTYIRVEPSISPKYKITNKTRVYFEK